MMKGRNILIALAVLAGLILAAVLVMREPPAAKVPATFPKMKKEDPTKLWVRRPVTEKAAAGAAGAPAAFEEVTLEKAGGKWMVTSPVTYEAYASFVDSALGRLAEIEIAEVAAEQKASHKELEVDDAQAVEVKVFKDQALLAHFFVGGYKGNATMVRFPKDEKVYRAKGSLRYVFAKPVRDWREKRIFETDNDGVTRLELTGPGGSFAFSKVEGDWKNESATPVPDYDAKKVAGVVSTVAHLRASDFADGVAPQDAGLGEGAGKVVVKYTEKKKDEAAGGEDAAEPPPAPVLTKTFLVGKPKDDQNSYLMAEGGTQVFLVSKYTAERLLPTVEKLATPPKKEEEKGAAAKPDSAAGGGAVSTDNKLPPEVMKKIEMEMKKQKLLKQLSNTPPQ